MTLQYPREKTLFVLLAVLASLFWVGATLATFGLLWLYVLLFFVFYLFAQSGFIAWLRGNGVEVTPSQYPDLHARHERACEKLGIRERPALFLVNSDGILNALATRFLGSNYVVLFSPIVDALQDDPDALDFYLGHELGHIRLKHLTRGWWLMPVAWLPLAGAAYRRAQEYSCDLHGSACCERDASAVNAMAVLAAGHTRWKSLTLDTWLLQLRATGGFWMSFHELTGDYPWLTKRMAHMLRSRGAEAPAAPGRHGMAWVLAAFIPRLPGAGGGGGGVLGLVMLVAIIGILAAVAIPAYQDYVKTAEAVKARTELEQRIEAGDRVSWDEVRTVLANAKVSPDEQEALRQRVFVAYVAPQLPADADVDAVYAEFAQNYPLPAEEAGNAE